MGTNKHVEQHDRTAEGEGEREASRLQHNVQEIRSRQFSSVPPPVRQWRARRPAASLSGEMFKVPLLFTCELVSNLAVRGRNRSASLPLGSAVHTFWLQRHDRTLRGSSWIMIQPESRLDWPKLENQRAAQITLRVNY